MTWMMLLLACGGDPATGTRPAPSVGVVEVESSDVPLEVDLRGRVEASRTAEVRARATGIVLERTFDEGQQVEAGQVLYRIDPAPMKAALAQARAQVAQARADLQSARSTAERLEPLRGTRAVSAQTYDDAVAARAAAEATLEAARAAEQAAALELEYATVTAPISGQIGRSMITEGALVSAGSATHMATIVQTDPVFVNLTMQVGELRSLRKALADGQLARTGQAARVRILDDNGYEHPHTGSLLFTDVTVEQSTGSTLVRASVPNPDQGLLPGMFVRARVDGALTERAFTIPQQSLQRSARGASVLVVEEGVAHQRDVEVSRSLGQSWVVRDGLADGDLVMADGFQHVSDGQPATPVPFTPVGEGELAERGED